MSDMTPVLWENLKTLANNAKVQYDTRYPMQKLKVDSCERLVKLGYAVFKGETGPGDSVQIYAITDAGREALTKHDSESAE
jgi:hypothetical protein